MVAPTSKNASAWNSSTGGNTLPGDVLRLFRQANASSQVAPTLHSFAREVLEAKKMHPAEIDLCLKAWGDISRYDRAFRAFYIFGNYKGVPLESASGFDVVGLLLAFHALNKNEARIAYSGLVLLPGWDQLKFSPLLKKCRQSWNTPNAGYGAFWDAGALLSQLA